jgi:ABC-2 type transport system permease protein
MTTPWRSGASTGGAIYDRGYRHYQGPREGRSRPIRAILWAGIRRTLGIKRPWRTKIVPFALLALAFVPAAVFVGVRVLIGEQADEFLSYPDFFGVIGITLLLFAATAGPELLCPDQRQRVLTLVFTRPVSRLDYAAGKFGALAVLMGTVALLPMLLVYVGNALSAPSAFSYLRGNLGDLGRILVTGLVLTVFYALVSLAVASLTDRRSIATASLLGLFLASAVLARILFYGAQIPGRRWLAFLALADLPAEFVNWMFGRPAFEGDLAGEAGFAGSAYLIALAVVAALSAAIVALRLRRVSQ